MPACASMAEGPRRDQTSRHRPLSPRHLGPPPHPPRAKPNRREHTFGQPHGPDVPLHIHLDHDHGHGWRENREGGMGCKSQEMAFPPGSPLMSPRTKSRNLQKANRCAWRSFPPRPRKGMAPGLDHQRRPRGLGRRCAQPRQGRRRAHPGRGQQGQRRPPQVRRHPRHGPASGTRGRRAADADADPVTPQLDPSQTAGRHWPGCHALRGPIQEGMVAGITIPDPENVTGQTSDRQAA